MAGSRGGDHWPFRHAHSAAPQPLCPYCYELYLVRFEGPGNVQQMLAIWVLTLAIGAAQQGPYACHNQG